MVFARSHQRRLTRQNNLRGQSLSERKRVFVLEAFVIGVRRADHARVFVVQKDLQDFCLKDFPVFIPGNPDDSRTIQRPGQVFAQSGECGKFQTALFSGYNEAPSLVQQKLLDFFFGCVTPLRSFEGQ